MNKFVCLISIIYIPNLRNITVLCTHYKKENQKRNFIKFFY